MNEQALRDRLMKISQARAENFNVTWHTFILERFLARIAKSKHRQQFIFKGGFLLGRYLDLGRETRDLDFLVHQLDSSLTVIETAVKSIATVDLTDGVSFGIVALRTLRHQHSLPFLKQGNALAHVCGTRKDAGTCRCWAPLLASEPWLIFPAKNGHECYASPKQNS